MSELSYLEKLLDGEEVEWKMLGDECFFKIANSSRKPVKASFRVFGKTPYYGANNIQDYVNGFTHKGEYVLIAEDGSKNLERYSIQYVEERFWANNHVHVIAGSNVVNTRYLYHYLCIVNFIPFLTGGGRAKLTKGEMIKIPVPIPCPDNPKKSLAIQGEIVRILDAFTSLTAELTTELTAELNMRKKQYNYYRNKLLTFEDGQVEWKTLGELFHLKNGYTPSKSKKEFWGGGLIPWFRMDDIRCNGKILDNSLQYITEEALKGGKLFAANSMIFATSATIGEHALITVPYLANQRFTNLTIKEKYIEIVDIKYLYYHGFLLADWCKQNTTMSSFASVDMGSFRKFKIPIPPLAEQSRIVSILDKFDALTNSISEGLPREINLRQKQYEYYRNQLLNFPKQKEEMEV